jgi:hypothetical protein
MGEGRGGRGAKSYDGEKALSSVNQSITSRFNTMIIIEDIVTVQGERCRRCGLNCRSSDYQEKVVIPLDR